LIPVTITDRAFSDLEDLWGFVAEVNPDAASRMLDALVEHGLALGEFPRSHPVHRVVEGTEVRRLNVGEQAIFYAVHESHVEVLRILDGRRDLGVVDFFSVPPTT
jgi:toxin ParE1/3/4